jgi:helicase
MKPEELEISKQFADILAADIKELNPVQISAVKAGILNLKDSFVIASPTASGKTLLAELLMIKAITEKHCKAIYVVPLRALATEKYERFKEKYEPLGVKVAISTGDFDSTDMWLANYDLVILTSEKADSLLRHKSDWMQQVGVAVIDEVHLLHDVSRGPTLEITITRLKKLNPEVLFLFLSATIQNADELAKWISAKLIKLDWRPVKLHQGVYFNNKVWFEERECIETNKNGEAAEVQIAEHTAKAGKQALVFAASRRNAESIAEKCCKVVKKNLSESEITDLAKLSDEIKNVLDSPTPQCKKLANCILSGLAFHHAGLVSKQRHLIEQAFRNRLIKIISATPTLAAGVDLPAYRVLIRDSHRYYPKLGYVYIPTLEYQQMAGRAGRPRYDKEGQSILVAHSEKEVRELYNKFVLGEPEEITSKLAVEPVLRMHVLALIASDVVSSDSELLDFFKSTFWGFQYKDTAGLKKQIDKVLKDLLKWNFVVQQDKYYKANRVGKRVAELYIDPLTAHEFILALEKPASDFGLLHLIANSAELSPALKVRKLEYDLILSELAKREQQLMIAAPKEWDIEYDDFLNSIKSALAFGDWCNEAGEELMYDKYRVTPGELHGKLDIADWLLYSIDELAGLLNKNDIRSAARRLRIRLDYGIKEELLQLVKLKGIGRARARRLFNASYKTLSDIRKASVIELAPLIGGKVAENVKNQLSDSSSGAVV